jgi:O-antigen ligase
MDITLTIKNKFDQFSQNKFELILFHLFIFHLFTTTISNYSNSSLYLKVFSGLLLIVSSLKGDGIKSFIVTQWSEKKVIAIILITFLLLPTISLLYTVNIQFGILKLTHFYVALLPALMAMSRIFSFNRFLLKDFTSLIIIYAALFSILILINRPFIHATAYSFSIDRWSHVLAGRFLTVALIISLYYLFKTTEWIRKIFYYLIPALLITSALYITALRASILAVIISTFIMIFILWMKKNINRKFVIITLLISITLIPLFLLNIKSIPHKRFNALYAAIVKGEYLDGAINARVEGNKICLEIFEESPIFGIGIGGFNGYNDLQITKMMKYPHNLIFEIGVELGVIGLFLFFLILILSGIGAYKFHPLAFLIFISAFILSLFSKDITSNSMLTVFFIFVFYRNKNGQLEKLSYNNL